MEIPSCRYLSDVLQKLPTHKVPQIEDICRAPAGALQISRVSLKVHNQSLAV